MEAQKRTRWVNRDRSERGGQPPCGAKQISSYWLRPRVVLSLMTGTVDELS